MKSTAAALACAMALAANAFHAEERRVVKEVIVKAPVEEVWKAWTTPAGLMGFFAPEAEVEPRPDGPLRLHFNPYAPAGSKGADDMRILAVQEQQFLSFTWNAPPHLPAARAQRTFVALRMHSASPQETHVRLTHSGWGDGGEWDQAFAYFDRAWGAVLGNLQKRFAEGPLDWKPLLTRMKAFQDEEDWKTGRKP